MSEELLDLIRKRRSVRRFAEGEVSDEQMDTLLEMAMCAPSQLDRQPWRFIVIRNEELQKQVADLLRLRPYLEAAPVVIAVCGLPETSPTWMLEVGAAAENLLLAAAAIGLGGVWIGTPDTVQWDKLEAMLRDQLAVPQNVRIPILLAVGHPAQEPAPHGRHDRFDPAKVHYGRWGQRKPS